jgi:uncharacterized protein (DUF302 family)
MGYHFSRRFSISFEEALVRMTNELKQEGFGIVTKIDIKEIFWKKINVEFRNYTILGACNPIKAYEGLLEEGKLGVFLPCNVVVQEHENGEVEISVANPEEMMEKTEDLNLKALAVELKASLVHALDHV